MTCPNIHHACLPGFNFHRQARRVCIIHKSDRHCQLRSELLNGNHHVSRADTDVPVLALLSTTTKDTQWYVHVSSIEAWPLIIAG